MSDVAGGTWPECGWAAAIDGGNCPLTVFNTGADVSVLSVEGISDADEPPGQPLLATARGSLAGA